MKEKVWRHLSLSLCFFHLLLSLHSTKIEREPTKQKKKSTGEGVKEQTVAHRSTAPPILRFSSPFWVFFSDFGFIPLLLSQVASIPRHSFHFDSKQNSDSYFNFGFFFLPCSDGCIRLVNLFFIESLKNSGGHQRNPSFPPVLSRLHRRRSVVRFQIQEEETERCDSSSQDALDHEIFRFILRRFGYHRPLSISPIVPSSGSYQILSSRRLPPIPDLRHTAA